MTTHARQAPTRRGLAATAAVLGVSTAVTLAIGWALAASAPGMEALAIGAMAVFATGIVGLAALVVGIIAVITARPRWVAIVGLAFAIAPLLFIASQLVPWSTL